MNYFSIEFTYTMPPHPRSRLYRSENSMVHINMGPAEDDPKLNKVLWKAIIMAEKTLRKARIRNVHEYAWPGDGNFYRLVRTKRSLKALENTLKRVFGAASVQVRTITKVDPRRKAKWETFSVLDRFKAIER